MGFVIGLCCMVMVPWLAFNFWSNDHCVHRHSVTIQITCLLKTGHSHIIEASYDFICMYIIRKHTTIYIYTYCIFTWFAYIWMIMFVWVNDSMPGHCQTCQDDIWRKLDTRDCWESIFGISQKFETHPGAVRSLLWLTQLLQDVEAEAHLNWIW